MALFIAATCANSHWAASQAWPANVFGASGRSDEFMMTFQRAVTELAWGYAWSRPGLEQKTRSILTLGILAGLGRFQELGIYTNAALSSGVTINELKEILVHITAYCGTPAGRQSFLAANETLKARKD